MLYSRSLINSVSFSSWKEQIKLRGRQGQKNIQLEDWINTPSCVQVRIRKTQVLRIPLQASITFPFKQAPYINNQRKLVPMAITAAKKTLRQEIGNVIKNLSVDEKIRQSKRVHDKLFGLPEYKTSQRISLYLSTADEVDTLPILKHIFDSKKSAFVPRYQGKTMEMVRLSSMEDYENLPLTKWNIKQPDAKEARENALETGGLDLVILPGVAFTLDGRRLGHGMGYYDKFLNFCTKKTLRKPYLVGVAFNEQVEDDIPTTEEDVILDLVLTGQ